MKCYRKEKYTPVGVKNYPYITDTFYFKFQRNRVAVEAMLESGRVDVDAGDPPARKLISDYFSDLQTLLPAEGTIAGAKKVDSISTLFDLLCGRKSSTFITKLGDILYKLPNNNGDENIQSRRKILNGDNGCWSFLQYACNAGMTDVARTLLENGADPNATSASRPNLLPSILAAAGGYDRIVELLLKYPNTRLFAYRNGLLGSGETVLHAVLKNAKWEPHNSDRRRCFDLLVAQDTDRLDVNAGDRNGDTALHLAAISGEEHYVLSLLRKGVYVGGRNVFGDLPLANIASTTLERFLDECVNSNDEFPRDDKFEITFNYSFLVPPPPPISSDQNHLDATSDQESSMIFDNRDHVNPEPESNPLLYISKSPDLRPLLKHPIFTSFLSLKWFTIRPFFILNVSFYAVFVFLLTVYILFIYDYPVVLTENTTNSNVVEETVTKGDVTMISEKRSGAIETLVWWILSVLFVILLLRELFQFIMWPKHYLLNFENYLEAALILVSALVLFGGFDNADVVRPHLSALAILLSWAELVLLIGKHPRLSTNIEMLMTVSKNFLQFLAWYSLLILAFALSFYTLFRSSQEDNNFFLHPGSSFFKTVIMVTGEFDASDIPFVLFPVTSHAVFVLFVFLVAIVLFNLLNGLAVSDTQVIKDDAKLVGYVSRVKLVSYTERMVLGHPLWCHTPTTCCCCCNCCCLPVVNLRFLSLHQFPSLIRRVRLFSSLVPEHVIRVLPNQDGKIVFSEMVKSDAEKYRKTESCCKISPCTEYRMEKQVINEAKSLLEEKSQMSDADLIEARLENFLQDKIERFEEMFLKLQDEIKTWQQKLNTIVQSKC